MERIPKKLYLLSIYIVLVLVTTIAFEQVRVNEFIGYDDNQYVVDNPQVKAGITHKSFLWAFTSTRASNWHPLTWLSHMLDCELFGLNPYGHHLTNLFFHVANTLLLFWVFNRMTGAVWRSAFVAVLFALHPLHVESVAWVAERKDVLSGLFWMLTIAAYVRYAERASVGRYLLVVSALCLGLMAKPMLVTLPLVLLLSDYWPLKRLQWYRRSEVEELLEGESATVTYQRASPRRLILEKIPLFGLAAASSAVTYIVQQKAGALKGAEVLSLNLRVANALVSYISYIGKIFYPHQLAVLYPHPGNSLPVWKTIVCLFVLVFISAGVIYWGRRRRYLVVGWLWYLVTLVPVIGLVQVGVQAMADRYTYLPSIGILIMIVWGVSDLVAKWRYRRVGLGITAGAVLSILVICTRVQLRHWQNNLALFGHTLEVTENNYVMHSNYGGALFEEGRFDEALVHFNEALRISPQYSDARRNIGIVLLRQGKIDEAIAAFTEMLSDKGDWPTAHNYLGLAYAQRGEFDLAVQNYNAALQLKPNYVEALKNLGILLKEQGKTSEAISKWVKALEFEPDNPDVHYNMGTVMAEQSRYEQAIHHFNITLAARPDWPEAHHNLGAVYYLQGKLDLAAKHCAEAISLRPDYHDAHYNMAMVMTRQDKLDEAIKHFNKALESKPVRPEVHYGLAGAFYQQGKLNLAAQQCAEALRVRPDYLAARITLAGILVELGETQSAVEHYHKALQLEPDQAYVLKNLAWILATSKDVKLQNPNDVVKLAVRACELTEYNQPEFLDTLAAAYAVAGRFSQAIEMAEKAINLAENTGKDDLAAEIRKRLQLYQAGQPYFAN